MSVELYPINRTAAREFVWENHRHNGANQRAQLMQVSLREHGEIVGVAIGGLPPIGLDDGRTVEITRVCTLGTKNACSQLYAAIVRAGTALGYRRFYTYTLEDEDGASVKAAGFVEDGLTDGRSASEKGGRPRYDENLLGERTRPEGRKRRWVRHVQARAEGRVPLTIGERSCA